MENITQSNKETVFAYTEKTNNIYYNGQLVKGNLSLASGCTYLILVPHYNATPELVKVDVIANSKEELKEKVKEYYNNKVEQLFSDPF